MIGGPIAAAILNHYKWHDIEAPENYIAGEKLESLFGPSFWENIRGKTVIDFGSGHGNEALEIAAHGAKKVIGLETLDRWLAIARQNLLRSGLKNCEFVKHTDATADVILSVDSFEHFDRPDEVLIEIARLLSPDGQVIVSFGPPWYHPRGGHMPLFPWAHLVFTEYALMKWRSKYKTDGAVRFREVDGGLNQMSIGKFERLVSTSPLRIASLDPCPIQAVRMFHSRMTREFFTSVVKARLVHR